MVKNMKLMLIATFLVTCLLLTGANLVKAEETNVNESPMIVINEFLYDSFGLELLGEFIEIANKGNTSVFLGNWVLTDQDGSDDLVFPNITLKTNELAVIFSRSGNYTYDALNGTHFLFMNKTSSTWSNRGDDILLLDDSENVIDYLAYGEGTGIDPVPNDAPNSTHLGPIKEGNSYSLVSGEWIESIPNPGAGIRKFQNILITEICPSAKNNGEFIALENKNNETLNIGFLTLTDGEGRATFPSGTLMDAGQTIFVAKNATSYQNLTHTYPDFSYDTNMIVERSSPSLSNDGDELFLINSDLSIIDAVVYGDSEYNGTGWTGSPVKKASNAEILKRHAAVDTNTSADWEDDSTYIAGQSEISNTMFNVTGEVRTFLSPDSSMPVLLDEIKNAGTSIKINLYQFLNEYLGEALIQASGRGVQVSLFVEGRPVGGMKETEVQFLSWLDSSGVEVRLHKSNDNSIAARYRFNHAKYMIIDESSTVIMTENWKYSGVPMPGYSGNRGWGIVVRDADVAGHYSRLFDGDWNETWYDVEALEVAEPVDFNSTGPASEFGGITPEFTELNISGDFTIKPVIVPDNTLGNDDPVLSMIGNATRSVLVEQFYIDTHFGTGSDGGTDTTPNVYLEAVIESARRGSSVRILLDSSEYNTRYSDPKDNDDTVRYVNTIAKTEGLDMQAKLVKPDGHTFTKIHAKGVIVDGSQTLISSINWNKNSITRNREVGIIIGNADVASYFTKAFDYDWEDLVHDPKPVIELRGVLITDRNITFSAVNSTASSNFTVKWDLDGDSKVDSFNQTAIWSYEEPGQYIITLEIEDIWGNVNTTSLLIEITEPETATAEEVNEEPVAYISTKNMEEGTYSAGNEDQAPREITGKDKITAVVLLLPMIFIVGLNVQRKLNK